MKKLITIIILILYAAVWMAQKGKASSLNDCYLSPALPAPVLKVVSGYAKQMAAFSLFVKVAVFEGKPMKKEEQSCYADSMAQNFDVMTDLYPEFIDSYHYCQSFLAPISPVYAQRTNEILERGILTHPGVYYLQFFQAFNYFYYMHQPEKSAEKFFEISKHPGAPPWFGHLAGILMGRGGNLVAGKTMLEAMLSKEQNKTMIKRYHRGIRNFDKAMQVQAALDRYKEVHGKDAVTLQELIPRYLYSLPKLEDKFKLVWSPPILHLESH